MRSLFIACCCVLVSAYVNAQSDFWAEIPNEDSIDYLHSVEVGHSNEVYCTYLRLAKGTSSISGTSVVMAVDSGGGEVWRTELDGLSNIADSKVVEDGIVVSGESFSKVDLGNRTIDSGMFFVLMLDNTGNPSWSYVNDSMDGEHSRLAVDPAGNIWVSAQVFFGNTTLIKLDNKGTFIQDKLMEGVTVSEMEFDNNGDLYFTGMMVRRNDLDTVEMNPPFGYANLVAKLDKGETALWARFTEYITFDWHHKLVCFDNKVYVFHRRLIAVNTPEASVIRYSDKGLLEKSIALAPNRPWPSADLAASDENVFVIFEKWNYSNPDVNDTLVTYRLNADLEIQDSLRVIGQIPTLFFGSQSFHLASDQCGFAIGTVISTDSISFNGEVAHTSNTENSIAVYSQGLCNEVLGVKTFHIEGFTVYPNPSNELVNMQWEGNGATMIEIYDLSGKQLYREIQSGNSAQINIATWASGLYTYKAVQRTKTTTGRFIVQ